MTSRHGDHAAACLEEPITTVQAPGDRKNPSVLWLNQQYWHLRDSFYFVYFINANYDHNIFFNSRIRFLVRSRLVPRIDSVWIPELGDFKNIEDE